MIIDSNILVMERRHTMDILQSIQDDIAKLEGRVTKQFREIAKQYKKEITVMPLDAIYELCESLLKSGNRGETIVAYQVIFDQRKKYTKKTFFIFEQWTFTYIRDWWDCDDFMTHAFGYLLAQYPEYIVRVKTWTTHDAFAVRRSAAVIILRMAQKGLLEESDIFEVCDLLMDDPHYLVQKGYGWLLKESSLCYQDAVIHYLETHYAKMTRTAFRYALEKLPKEERQRLMHISS